MLKYFTLLIISLLIEFSSQATPTRIVPDKETIEISAKSIRYYISPSTSSKQVSSVSKSIHQFKPIHSTIVNLGFETRDVWFFFELDNKQNPALIRNLHLSNPILDEVDIYQKIGSNTWILINKGGDQRPFDLRQHQQSEQLFQLQIPENSNIQFLMRVNNGGEQFYFNTTLEKDIYTKNEAGKHQLFFGILFGIMGFIILLNFSMGLLFKQRIAYIYTLYAVFFTLLQFSLQGLGTAWLWTDQYFIINRANPVLATLGVYFFLHFTYQFLDIGTYMPKFGKWILRFQYLLILNLILALIPGESFLFISALAVNAMTVLLNIAIIIPLIIILKRGNRSARSYFVAFSVLQFSVFVFVFRNFGILPDSFLANNGLQLGAATEMIILTIAILQRFKLMNDDSVATLAKANKLKEELNIKLEIEVAERTQEVILQRNELAEKNEEIVDSINYAKRIQLAILPSQISIQRMFQKAHVWYAPKDIIAGDFYWFKDQEINGQNYRFFAVADCTGHGVPGAMMSVLCMNALNESCAKLSTASTNELLIKTSDYLSVYLSSDDQQLADGMDISIACYSESTQTLIWSGANNPLWVMNDSEITVYSPTKRPIGKTDSSIAFEEHFIQLEKGTRVFLFSDGLIDQFGGQNGKKLKTKGLRAIVESSLAFDITSQAKHIQDSFLDWKNSEEQIDDVCMLLIEF
ncbi:MAG: SpoIIE family protein phosphatase [Fluviicola sp.]|nr:SpoIIE family protein phosphatase [Fluviicola sp.]